jgi:hypothetical protein
MTLGDLIHAVLLLVGFCAGLAVGSRWGIAGMLLGAVAGFAIGHIFAIGLTVGELVVFGLVQWRSRK